MHRECRERFPRHRLQRKSLVSDTCMHHGTCVTHVPWCMSGSLASGGGENVPGIPGACATRNFMYLIRGPWRRCKLKLRPSRSSNLTLSPDHHRPGERTGGPQWRRQWCASGCRLGSIAPRRYTQECVFENVFQMATILLRSKCVRSNWDNVWFPPLQYYSKAQNVVFNRE